MKKKCFLICAAAALTLGCAVGFAPLEANAQTVPMTQAVITDEAIPYVELADADYDSVYDIDAALGQDNSYEYVTTGSESKKKSVDWVKVILISVAISAVVTGITVFVIYRGYKHNGETEPYEFTKKAPLELTGQEDTLVDVRVTTRTINRDNN